MASIQEAIKEYGPEIELEETVPLEESVEFLSEKTELDPETIQTVLGSLEELAFWFFVRGRPILLPKVGRLFPEIQLNGSFEGRFEMDESLRERMGEPEAFRAGIDRRENIGVSLERMAEMWNSSHPEDPITDLDAYPK